MNRNDSTGRRQKTSQAGSRKRGSRLAGRAPVIIVVNNPTININLGSQSGSGPGALVVPNSHVEFARLGLPGVWGIDVSHWQDQIDWARVKQEGPDFAFLKATEGGDIVDATYARNWKETKDKGILRGPYHFFRPRTNLQTQIDNFSRVIEANGIGVGDLPPVLDAEEPKLWKGIGKKAAADLCVGFLEGVKKNLGLRVPLIIYMSSSFSEEILGADPRLKQNILWVADYTPPVPGQPRVPKPWDSWDFYQFTEHGTMPGINGKDVDINRFNGDRSRLQSLLIR